MESQLSRNGAETDADMEEGKYVAEESRRVCEGAYSRFAWFRLC